MKQTLLKILYRFLAFSSRIYLARTKPLVIGITGSVGKTSCRMVLSQVLEQIQKEKKIYTSPKNFNSELGLIFSIFQIEEYNPSIKDLLKLSLRIFKTSLFGKKKYDILIAEYGIDAPGDMDFLLSIMKPDIGIITRLDSVHADNFPRGIMQLWEEKFQLLLASKIKTYCNAGDDFCVIHTEYLSNNRYIFQKKPTKITFTHEGNILKQHFLYQKKNISINLVGSENVEYTRLALDIAKDLKIKIPEKKYDFEFEIISGRFSIIERNNHIFIDSTYNAGPESMKQVILNTQEFQTELYPKRKLIYVLGDMREIGDEKKVAHEDIANLIMQAQAIFTIGPEMYRYTIPKLKELGFLGELHSSLSSREIGVKLKNYLKDNSQNSYIILFKGSQNTIFTEEALSPQLTPTQRKSLPRQSEDWKAKKKEFFMNL